MTSTIEKIMPAPVNNNLDLSKLQGCFVSAEIHPKEIILPDGSKAIGHFKEPSVKDIQRYRRLFTSEKETEVEKAIPTLIASSFCTEDGELILTVEQASNLKPKFSDKLSSIVLELAGFGLESEDNQPGKE